MSTVQRAGVDVAPIGEASAWPLMLSIATTAYNEAGNVTTFLSEALLALRALGVTGEIIYIDDGSNDRTDTAVMNFAQGHKDAAIRLVRHPARRGITAAIQESVALAKGEFICFLPADLESSPANDVPLLYRALDPSTDVVVGWRKGRQDGKLFSSRVYNFLNRWLFNLRLHDANWIKLVRHNRIHGIRLRSDWHRFLLPILAHRGCRIKEIETPWHPRAYGRSKFGLKRFPVSLADMLAVKFLLTYGKRPLLFYGWLSVISFILAIIATLAAFLIAEDDTRAWVAMLMLSGALFLTGIVSGSLGLLGELTLGWEGMHGDERTDKASGTGRV